MIILTIDKLNMCVYLCINLYTHSCMWCIYIYIYIYFECSSIKMLFALRILAQNFAKKCVCVYACAYAPVLTYMLKNVYVCTYGHTFACIHATHMYVNIILCTHVTNICLLVYDIDACKMYTFMCTCTSTCTSFVTRPRIYIYIWTSIVWNWRVQTAI